MGSLGAVQAFARQPQQNSDPNGWIWSYVATSGDKEKSGTFRVSNLQVFKNGKKVGHIDPKGGAKLGDATTLILTDFGKLTGTAELVKSHKKPAVWAGTMKAKDGTEWHFKAKLVEK
jgi:hypothetical protein